MRRFHEGLEFRVSIFVIFKCQAKVPRCQGCKVPSFFKVVRKICHRNFTRTMSTAVDITLFPDSEWSTNLTHPQTSKLQTFSTLVNKILLFGY